MSIMKRITLGVSASVLIILVATMVLHSGSNSKNSNTTLHVVAGENFWGSLAEQIGGSHVSVTSIVSDPNADPHEYENSNANARDFASADYVILNGAGYDSWGNKLLSASARPNRKLLIIADLLSKKNGDNPHFWYSPTYVSTVISQITAQYVALDPKDASYFKQHSQTLQSSLAGYQARIADIKKTYARVQVAATEDIFQYLADASGLDLISPQPFIQAVAEGNDPPTDSVATFQKQLQSGQVHILVYNKQTVTPLTETMKKLAIDQHIPIVGVTETIQPSSATFQDWMNAQLVAIQASLHAQKSQ